MMAPCCMFLSCSHLPDLHWSDFTDLQFRRYLRARKFDVPGAIGQFTDTEKWMKEQNVEDLYEHFDVDFYERARKLV